MCISLNRISLFKTSLNFPIPGNTISLCTLKLSLWETFWVGFCSSSRWRTHPHSLCRPASDREGGTAKGSAGILIAMPVVKLNVILTVIPADYGPFDTKGIERSGDLEGHTGSYAVQIRTGKIGLRKFLFQVRAPRVCAMRLWRSGRRLIP